MSNVSCSQIEPLLSAYRDGELSESERKEAEKHITACAVCQNRLIELEAVVAALKALPRLEPKVDYAANIEQLLAAQPKQSKFASRKPIIWGGVGIAAAAAVVLAVGNLKPTLNAGPSVANSTAGTAQNVTAGSARNEGANASRNEGAARNEVAPQIAKAGADAKLNSDDQDSSNGDLQNNLASANSKDADSRNTVRQSDKGNGAVDPNKPVNRDGKRMTSKYNPHTEVASAGVTGGDTVPASDMRSGLKQNVVASEPGKGLLGDGNSDSNLVAVYETDQKNVTEELGITTDEDGLYAIKL